MNSPITASHIEFKISIQALVMIVLCTVLKFWVFGEFLRKHRMASK
jgi:hypothetical protein